MLYPQKCKNYRLSEVLDQYNTPTSESETLVGTYSCRLSKKTIVAKQGDISTESSTVYYLYFPPYTNVDIQLGDLPEVDGVRYRASEPYKAYNGNRLHHIEVEVYFDKEA